MNQLLIRFVSQIGLVFLSCVPAKDNRSNLMPKAVVDDHPSGFVDGIPHLTITLLSNSCQLLRPKPLSLTFLQSGHSFVVPLGLQMSAINDETSPDITDTGQPVVDAVVNTQRIGRIQWYRNFFWTLINILNVETSIPRDYSELSEGVPI